MFRLLKIYFCHSVSAPEGHLIKLDFRDWFAIEDSPECKNDYLEVRDGPHGYNNKLESSSFCGTKFPPMLTSSDRHLWIRFHSDENIEYKGFKAVFEYIPRPPSCKLKKIKQMWRTIQLVLILPNLIVYKNI